ncbi:1-phosphofructokinase [Vibrio sagamiensis]|uniref:Phosphofructokinase n=1 Tax=Vibrio sagamiensis NBRC 104589 TaxID=1219064 RepID=A0A511QFP2_9VIBR|nr:1-phosphofructokinase [Vibrio sagamiensis]PNQ58953.1 1-phosphofructokinase [Vibrio agarivorans]GEM76123.1 phosphofructokinase [Vibrio sagamiensis NBRC 104589]
MICQTTPNTSTKKVVTVTLNPALDLTGSLDTLNVGNVNIINESHFHAAGKGINVAKVLAQLGAEVTVTGFLGQNNTEPFEQLFNQLNVTDAFIRVAGDTRINVKLVEDNGQVSEINFPGLQISKDSIAQFENTLYQLMSNHDYFVFSGSLPAGVCPTQLAIWIEHLGINGKKVMFDSSKSALAEGIKATPWLIKPNHEELGEYLGRELDTKQACIEGINQLSHTGIKNTIVSMGSLGVIWRIKDEYLYAQPPVIPVVSTVGAGDSLVAGICWGHIQSMEPIKLLRFATALSALAVTQIGVGFTSQNELKFILEQTQVSHLSADHLL